MSINLDLLTEFEIGGQKLRNRVVLAPLTRARYVRKRSACEAAPLDVLSSARQQSIGWMQHASLYNYFEFTTDGLALCFETILDALIQKIPWIPLARSPMT